MRAGRPRSQCRSRTSHSTLTSPASFSDGVEGLLHVRAGKVKALAITSRSRYSGAPEVPIVAKLRSLGFQGAIWYGIVAPAKVAPELVTRLHAGGIHGVCAAGNYYVGQGDTDCGD